MFPVIPCTWTILRALSMSMPWLQGTAGLARQSPALPLRDTSTRCRRRYRKASAITRMASWVSADVYFSGVFLASGNSLSSRRSQRWRNCWTMGLSGLMIWKPVMLAPPEKTLSRLMLEKPRLARI